VNYGVATRAASEAAAAEAAARDDADAARSAAEAARALADDLREELRNVRGDVASAAAAALEMERHVAATQRAAADAVIKHNVSSAGKDLASARLREKEREIAEVVEAQREAVDARDRMRRERDDAAAAADKAAKDLHASRASERLASEKLAGALAAAAAAEALAADNAAVAAALRHRLFPNGVDPDAADAPRRVLKILRATLFVDDDEDDENDIAGEEEDGTSTDTTVQQRRHRPSRAVDVTEAVRKLAADSGGLGVRVKVSDNLRTLLGADFAALLPPPPSDATTTLETTGFVTDVPVPVGRAGGGRLVILYRAMTSPATRENDLAGSGAFYTNVFHPYVARFQHLIDRVSFCIN
jgi:hypothetical protein